MDLNAKAAYIRGLMTGMEFDAASPNGKVIAAMMDLLEQMAAEVTQQGQALDQANDNIALLAEDLTNLADEIYDDYEDEDYDGGEEDDALYEVTCPRCGRVSTVDEETLLKEEIVCPGCGAAFDIELEGEEDEDAPAPSPLFVMPKDGDDE